MSVARGRSHGPVHSDGLSPQWELDAYPGLSPKSPSLIAAVLYRDFVRRRDDVVVVVARERVPEHSESARRPTMSTVLLQFDIHGEPGRRAAVRNRRARELSTLLGFDLQDQTSRIATAASEVARNAFQYASGGKVTFSVDAEGTPEFVVQISDSGPGIANLKAVLDGRVKSRTGLGVGLLGSRKLMDVVRVDSIEGGGTTVELRKALPAQAPMVTPKLLSSIETELSRPSRKRRSTRFDGKIRSWFACSTISSRTRRSSPA